MARKAPVSWGSGESGLGSLTISVLPGFSSIRDSPLNNALRANGVEPNAITAEHSVILLRLEVYNGSHDSCRGGHGM